MFGRYLHTEAVYCRWNKVQRVQVEYVVLKVERGLDDAVFCTAEAVFYKWNEAHRFQMES